MDSERSVPNAQGCAGGDAFESSNGRLSHEALNLIGVPLICQGLLISRQHGDTIVCAS